MTAQNETSLAWIGRLVTAVLRTEWHEFVPRLLAVALTTLVVVTVLLYTAVQFFGFRIDAGKVYLGVGAQATSPKLAVVDSTTGWQNSRIYVHEGTVLRLEPVGRIHIAADQVHNLATVVKPLILMGSPDRNWAIPLRDRYRPVTLDESKVFYRDWIGPGGENISSDMLDMSKIRPDLNWGSLLVAVFPIDISDRMDPIRALKDADIRPAELVSVSGLIEMRVLRSGWLTFIINEAVLSPASESEDSRELYGALMTVKESLSDDSRHQLHESAIPLIWFSDNIGSFRVYVSQK